jgi:glycosyltransferase involved in cell wall biosynthesis
MKISAVIPCYNAEPFLAEAIESILRQTRPVDELIVVDDGSTDASRRVAARYPLTLIRMTGNAGHAAARNTGIDAARGDVIVWLDADDYFNPNHVETVCGLLERHPQADVAFTCVRRFGAKTGLFGHNSPCCETPRRIFRECLRRTVVPAMSVATRTDALRGVGGFNADIRIAPDFDLWLRMSLRHLFVSSNEVTVNYRWHPDQISAQPHRQWRSMYESRHRLYRQLREDDLPELAEQVRDAILEIWEEELRADWRRRDLQALKFRLLLSDLVPGTSRVASRWKLRARYLHPASGVLKRIAACWADNSPWTNGRGLRHAHPVDRP